MRAAGLRQGAEEPVDALDQRVVVHGRDVEPLDGEGVVDVHVPAVAVAAVMAVVVAGQVESSGRLVTTQFQHHGLHLVVAPGHVERVDEEHVVGHRLFQVTADGTRVGLVPHGQVVDEGRRRLDADRPMLGRRG